MLGWTLVAGFFTFCGLILFLRYSVLPNIEAHRPRLEQLAGEGSGCRCISNIAAGWQGLNPDLTFRMYRIDDGDGRPALAFRASR